MTVTFVVAIAVLLGLLLFLYNEVRRAPGPAQWGHVPRWPKRLRIAFAAIVLFIAGAVFWGFLIEPGRLVIREQTIQIDNWPQPLDGLRIAVLSDIHVDNWFITEKKLRTIVERTNQLQPELIVILGDYMSSNGRVTRRVEPGTRRVKCFRPRGLDREGPILSWPAAERNGRRENTGAFVPKIEIEAGDASFRDRAVPGHDRRHAERGLRIV